MPLSSPAYLCSKPGCELLVPGAIRALVPCLDDELVLVCRVEKLVLLAVPPPQQVLATRCSVYIACWAHEVGACQRALCACPAIRKFQTCACCADGKHGFDAEDGKQLLLSVQLPLVARAYASKVRFQVPQRNVQQRSF